MCWLPHLLKDWWGTAVQAVQHPPWQTCLRALCLMMEQEIGLQHLNMSAGMQLWIRLWFPSSNSLPNSLTDCSFRCCKLPTGSSVFSSTYTAIWGEKLRTLQSNSRSEQPTHRDFNSKCFCSNTYCLHKVHATNLRHTNFWSEPPNQIYGTKEPYWSWAWSDGSTGDHNPFPLW